jgi:flagellar biosynthesis/type III secretory pathway protein FliH
LRVAREQGLAEGRAEGLAEGRAEGKSELLVAMVESRFGRLSESQAATLRGATSAELDQYAIRLMTATTVTDIF